MDESTQLAYFAATMKNSYEMLITFITKLYGITIFTAVMKIPVQWNRVLQKM
jgi:hypothetical protein